MILRDAEIHHWLRGEKRCRLDTGLLGRRFPVELLVEDVCWPIFSVSLIVSGTKALLYSAWRAHRPLHQLITLHTHALIIHTNSKIAEVRVNYKLKKTKQTNH